MEDLVKKNHYFSDEFRSVNKNEHDFKSEKAYSQKLLELFSNEALSFSMAGVLSILINSVKNSTITLNRNFPKDVRELVQKSLALQNSSVPVFKSIFNLPDDAEESALEFKFYIVFMQVLSTGSIVVGLDVDFKDVLVENAPSNFNISVKAKKLGLTKMADYLIADFKDVFSADIEESLKHKRVALYMRDLVKMIHDYFV